MHGGSRDEASRAADSVARRSYGKLVAFLAARTSDIASAEDALADAFAAALVAWGERGVPDNPEAWLLTTARRRQIDQARHVQVRTLAQGHVIAMMEEIEAATAMSDIPDDRLRLMFACAHPAIDRAMRAPLILQTVLGFDATTIGSAFLVAPATMAQRLVRAKAKIRQAGVPFVVPERDQLDERLDAVLDAIYATFAEGWSDPLAADSQRRGLAPEAIWLGRLVCQLMPREPEAFGLLALMLHAHARRNARRTPEGRFVPLSDQDTTLWDGVLIDEAEDLLRSASGMGARGRFQIEAAIQSAHAVRRITGRSDWAAIARLYDALATVAPSPVIEINRAVTLAESQGPQAGIAALDAIHDDPRLAAYQPYWATRADLLARLGDRTEARDAYLRAIGLESDPAIRDFLQERLARMG